MLKPFPKPLHLSFLAKNKRPSHKLDPVSVPSWLKDGSHHFLCPLSALKKHMNSFSCICDRLWINPHNNKICNTWDLSKVICQVIKEAVPGSNLIAHQVRSWASSIAFLRSFDLTKVQS